MRRIQMSFSDVRFHIYNHFWNIAEALPCLMEHRLPNSTNKVAAGDYRYTAFMTGAIKIYNEEGPVSVIPSAIRIQKVQAEPFVTYTRVVCQIRTRNYLDILTF